MVKPKYIMVAAVSLDGFIAPRGKPGSAWTSAEDKKFLRKMLDTADLVVVGNTTYKLAREPLSKRNCAVLTRTVRTTKTAGKLKVYINPKNVKVGDFIKRNGYRRVIVLGGSQTYTYCLRENLLDEIYLTIEPIIFGAGLPLFRANRKISPELRLKGVKRLGSRTILINYQVLY